MCGGRGGSDVGMGGGGVRGGSSGLARAEASHIGRIGEGIGDSAIRLPNGAGGGDNAGGAGGCERETTGTEPSLIRSANGLAAPCPFELGSFALERRLPMPSMGDEVESVSAG